MTKDPPFKKYTDTFLHSYTALMEIERPVYTENPNDPRTNCGITEQTYNDFYKEKKEKGHTMEGWPTDVKYITEEHAKLIYYEYYWIMYEICSLPDELAHHMFFMAVLSGPERALSILFKSTNNVYSTEYEDLYDFCWLQSKKSNIHYGELVISYANICRKFLRSLKKYEMYGKGWEKRIDWALRTGNVF